LYLNHIEQAKEQIGRELTFEERCDLWVDKTGKNINQNMSYWLMVDNIPIHTREPYPLPKVIVQDGMYCSSLRDIILLDYQSHPAIKAPLSN